jgi:hypothetical protein
MHKYAMAHYITDHWQYCQILEHFSPFHGCGIRDGRRTSEVQNNRFLKKKGEATADRSNCSGALHTQYDYFKRLIMKMISKEVYRYLEIMYQGLECRICQSICG